MTPFATGYTEAMLAELNGRRIRATSAGLAPYTVDDLAPATLSRIIADCERMCEGSRVHRASRKIGRICWETRQRNDLKSSPDFPPLLVTLGDDGLIYLREAGQ